MEFPAFFASFDFAPGPNEKDAGTIFITVRKASYLKDLSATLDL